MTDWHVGWGNYRLMNVNNIYNCLIDVLGGMPDDGEQRTQMLNSIKVQIGMTIYNDFKMYVFKKLPQSKLLALFK